jgi:putative ATP-dependent nuclease
MLDWKRSKNLIDQDGNVIRDSYNHTMGLGVLSHLPDCSYYHYAMQQSGYRYILKKNYGIEIEACWLAVFHPTLLNYKLIRLPYLEEEVKAVLAERAARFR